jgi:hypothetical protein
MVGGKKVDANYQHHLQLRCRKLGTCKAVLWILKTENNRQRQQKRHQTVE